MSGVLQMVSSAIAECRSCGKSLVFARSARTGKLMPFERDDAAGEWSIVNGSASHVGKAPAVAVAGVESLPRWTSHFARCPDAKAWRRR